jgi:hypothetical protein
LVENFYKTQPILSQKNRPRENYTLGSFLKTVKYEKDNEKVEVKEEVP